MKSTIKITSKGQVTFRKEVLDQLGVRPGDKITVEFLAPGRAKVRAARTTGTLARFVGCLKAASTPALSIEDMNEIARDGWSGKR